MTGVGVSVTTLAARGCAAARLPLAPWLVVARRPGTAAAPLPGRPAAAPDIAANTQNDEAIVGDIARECSDLSIASVANSAVVTGFGSKLPWRTRS
jgi:hypothetical protein